MDGRARERARSRRRTRRQRIGAVVMAVTLGVAVVIAVVIMHDSDDSNRARPHGASVEHFDFSSTAIRSSLAEIVVLPRDFDKRQHRPLLVMLHGRGSRPSAMLNDELMDALARVGDRAPVVLLANGGTSSYYHDRRGGRWGTYITDELVRSTVRKYQLDPQRVAYAGISMGGYGALELTRESGRHLCGVAGLAPALWLRAGDSAPGAFDDAEDFESHDVLGAVRADSGALHDTPVFLAGGSEDPFREGTDALADALRSGSRSVIRRRGSGGHDGRYWNRQFRPMIAWFAQRFATC